MTQPPNLVTMIRPQDLQLKTLPFRFPARTALTMQAELRQLEACQARGYPRIKGSPVLRDEVLSVVGYGPTLHETWSLITPPLITVSGAHDFLIERGVVPTWHAECDGREHKAKHLEHPHPDVIYLMSAICCPLMWDQLAGHKVEIWYSANGQHIVDWIAQHDDGALLVAGGTVIGNMALHLGGYLGFRKFRLFGFDGHLLNGHRHAGPHYGPPQKIITRHADRRTWTTTPQMSNACDELLSLLDEPAIESMEIVGDSLQAALAKDLRLARAWWEDVFALWTDTWEPDAQAVITEAEPRRALAKFNTGSIGLAAAVALRGICEWLWPKDIVEIGTFIGTSTLSLRARGHLYTCDKDNDCLPSAPGRTCFPYQTSTEMLSQLLNQGVRNVDLFFFDGRIQPADLPMIDALAHPNTVYVFDDYTGQEKGVVNVFRLQPQLPDHALIEPCGIVRGTMTLAALVPRSLLS